LVNKDKTAIINTYKQTTETIMLSFLIIVLALAAFIAVSFGIVYALTHVFNPGNEIDLGAAARAAQVREEFYQKQLTLLKQAELMRKHKQDLADMAAHKQSMELAAYKQQYPYAFKD
jgi:hypothetical protein